MCDTRELLKARDQVRELTAKLAELEQPPKPDTTLLSMPSADVKTELDALSQQLMYPCLLDSGQNYYYTNSEGWAEVFNYIYTVFKMPTWVAARFDCEDSGILLKGLVSALFGLNYFALTIGDIPEGTHGFNFFRTEQGHLIIEPQTAEFFGWEEKSYSPKFALL